MNEPCRHEREARSTLEDFQHAAQKALRDASHEIALQVALVATKDAAIDAMAVVIVARDATIERVTALCDDPDGELWAVRGVPSYKIRAALGMP